MTAAVLARAGTSPVAETLQGVKGKKVGLDEIGSGLFFKFSVFMKAKLRVAEPGDKLLQRAILIEKIMMKSFAAKIEIRVASIPSSCEARPRRATAKPGIFRKSPSVPMSRGASSVHGFSFSP